MINSSISFPVVVSLPSHVADDSWTGSERQVTFCYRITTKKKSVFLLTSSVCRSKPLWPRTFLISILSQLYWTILGCSRLCLWGVLNNIEVFSFGINPWSQPQPQPGDEAHSWGRPWACPPEPLLWRAWRKIQFCICFSIFVFKFHSKVLYNEAWIHT